MELKQIQKIEQGKQRVSQDFASRDSAMRAFARKLRDAQQVLEQTLEDNGSYKNRKQAKTSDSSVDDLVGLGDLKVSEIISYARRISYTTFAPPEFSSGQDLLRGAMPPAPQEEQMRVSLLYQFADLDAGTRKETVIEALPVVILETHRESMTDDPILPGVIPGVPFPAMLPGWRPGMPIEYSPMPSMPLRWKPGDPVPSPPPGWKPGDAVVFLEPEEKTQMPPKLIASARPIAETTQVPFVELDIKPDNMADEYSSDYSTEEGCSEEEED